MHGRFPNYVRNPNIWRIILAGYWAVLFTATHLPTVARRLPGENTDKFIHFAAFAVLAVLAAFTWKSSASRLKVRHLCAIWALTALYGALDELTQGLVGRNASVSDWAADVVGAVIGVTLFGALQQSISRGRNER